MTVCEKLEAVDFGVMSLGDNGLDRFPGYTARLDFFANRGGALDSAAVCEEMAVLAVFGPSAINHLGSHFRKPALSRGASRGLRRRQFRTSGWIMWSLPELRWSDSAISTREKVSVCEIWGRARQVVGGKRDGGGRHRRLHRQLVDGTIGLPIGFAMARLKLFRLSRAGKCCTEAYRSDSRWRD